MRYTLLIITSFLFAIPFAYAQNCGTIISTQDASFMNMRLTTPKFYGYNQVVRAKGKRTFKLNVNVLTSSNGQASWDKSTLQPIIQSLNTKYAKGNVQLIIGEVNFINETRFYDFDKSEEDAMGAKYDEKGSINMYIVNTITMRGIGMNARIAGYSYMPGGPDRVVMDAHYVNDGTTLIHELGHYFGLAHTHGTTNGGTTNELVDGSNCGTAGDNICDTPADPNVFGKIRNSDCSYIGNVLDARGNPYSPETDNYMSYAPAHCCSKFTQGQYDVINYTAFEIRNYLTQPKENPAQSSQAIAQDYFNKALKAQSKENQIILYTKALDYNPQMAAAYNNRGWVKYQLGKNWDALIDINKALAIEQHEDYYHSKGEIYLTMEKYEKAVQHFDQALAINPNMADAKRDREKAIRAWNIASAPQEEPTPSQPYEEPIEVVSVPSENAETPSAYFEAALAEKDHVKAIRLYSKVIKLDPRHAMAYNNRGWLKAELKDYSGGLKDANKAIALQRDKDMYHTRGFIYYGLGQYQNAINDYDRALAIDPTYSYATEDRQKALDKLSRPGSTVSSTTSKPSKPKSPNYGGLSARDYFNLARSAKDRRKKIDYYTKAIQKDPRLSAALNNRGYIYMELREYNKALADLNRAISVRKSKDYYHTRGQIYMRLRDYRKSISDFDRALAIDPNFREARVDRAQAERFRKQQVYSRVSD